MGTRVAGLGVTHEERQGDGLDVGRRAGFGFIQAASGVVRAPVKPCAFGQVADVGSRRRGGGRDAVPALPADVNQSRGRNGTGSSSGHTLDVFLHLGGFVHFVYT